ncbi:MAG: PAS domain S-box protein [Balneolaceae bacterium]
MADKKNNKPVDEGQSKPTDWLKTILGNRDNWPQNLQTVYSLCENSSNPSCIFWGEDFILLFNKSWDKLTEGEFTSKNGKPAQEVFNEKWNIFSKILKQVKSTGKTKHVPNLILHLFEVKPSNQAINLEFSPIRGIESVEGVFTSVIKPTLATEEQHFYPQIFDSLPEAIYTTDAKGRLTHYNSAAIEFSQEVPELGTDNWYLKWKLFWPNGAPMSHEECPMAIVLKEEKSIEDQEVIAQLANGKFVWFSAHPTPLRDKEGNVIGGVNMMIDITEQKKLEQLQLEQRQLLELIASGSPLDKCLTALCKAVPRLSPDAKASVIMADEVRKSIEYTLSPNQPQSFKEGLKGAPINELSIGTCGEALYKGYPVMCSDIAADSKWSKPWRELCLSHNIKACHSSPIFAKSGDAIASFMMCFSEPREPTKWELRISDFGSHIASIALERDRENKAILKSEDRYRTLFESIDQGFCLFEKTETEDKPDFIFIETNPAFEQQTKLSDIIGKRLSEATPEVAQSWIETLNKVLETGEPIHVENYLSTSKYVFDINAFPTGIKEEQKVAVLLINITERKQTEYLLKRNEERAVFLTILNDAFRPLYDPVAIQDEAIRVLAEHLNLNRAGYGEIEEQGRAIIQRDYAQGVPNTAGILNLQEHDPEMLKELRTGQTVVMNDLNEADITSKQKAAYDSIQIKAHVTVPLLKGGALLAVLSVHQAEPRDWQEDEIALIEETAERTWAAVEHARTAKQLRESEKKYRTLFDSMDEGFCIMKKISTEDDAPTDFRIIETNPAFEWQSGIPDPDSKTLREILPDIDPEWIKNYEHVLETGHPLRFEVTIPSPERILNLYAFKTGEPGENKIAVILNNITEEKRSEAALRKSEERLKAALEGTGVGVWDLNLETNKAWRSIKHDQIFGYDALQKVWSPKTLFKHVISEDRKRIRKKLEATLANDGNWDFECRIIRTDGEKKWISVHSKILRGYENDNTKRLIGTIQDITERKQDEEKLEKINETLEERVEERTSALLSYQEQLRSLASQLSKAEERERHRLAADLHDNLGQLLAMIKMELDLIDGKFTEKPEMKQIKDLVSEAVSYTRELMSDLKPPPSLDDEDIVASVDWVANKMKKHGLKVSIVDDELPKLMTKEIRDALLQSVREALFNVVKHAGTKEARIKIASMDGNIRISVQDKGSGFNPTKKNLSVTDEGGFGLFSIRERLDLLGGNVHITSIPGTGTTIDLYAPLLKESDRNQMSAQNGASRQAEISYQESDKIRVMLVDDHKMMLKGLRRIVEQQDDLIVIAEAMNGEEAVELARKYTPDVIIMDVDMPVMNGIDATREIVSTIENVRVIGLSLHEKGSVAQAMRNAGASAYLTKTEAFEALSATIRSEAVLAKK